MIIWIICFIILISIAIIFLSDKEPFAGAMVQMYAKNPEDTYLTSNIEQYIPPYFNNTNWYWNAPTRIQDYPLYGIYPASYVRPYPINYTFPNRVVGYPVYF